MKLVTIPKHLLYLFFFTFFLAPQLALAESQLFVSPEVESAINAGDRVEIIAHFSGTPDLAPAYGMSWTDRGRWVHQAMTEASQAAQSDLRGQLRAMGADYRPLNAFNMIVIPDADNAILQTVIADRSVRGIFAKPEFFLTGYKVDGDFDGGARSVEPNLDQIRASDVWNQLGITGEDVVVGINDTSVRYTHNALVNQYRGNLGDGDFDHNYSWYDPNTGAPAPFPEFHGTHVAGIAVGDDGADNQIGVAPGAKWMACGGCAGGACGGVIECLDWMTAPTDVNGDNPDPDQRAHLVNNSWGSCAQTHNAGLYDPIFDSMYAAGVIPFFSNGNNNAFGCGYPSPPGLNTVGDPARNGRVLGIGSTTQTGGNYAFHSNWGPTDNDNPGMPDSFDHFGYPDLKPNVSVPGQGIRSAVEGSDSGYGGATGTSMASPHAAGVVALMISAAPVLAGDFQTIGTILQDTAIHVEFDGGGAGDPDVEPGVNHPNYASGWGEIDALAAVEAAIAAAGPQGIVAGTVTNADTGAPIESVNVLIENPEPPPAEWLAFTDSDGQYEMSVSITDNGGYTVEFSRNGFESAMVTDVEVNEGETTTVDIALDPVDSVEVSGVITDANTSSPIAAQVSAVDEDGFPYGPVTSDSGTGAYSLDLPEGLEYSLTAFGGGYESETREIGPLTSDLTEDFELAAGIIELPGTASLTLLRGTEDSVSVEIDNTGTADAEITLALIADGDALDEDFETSFPPAGWTVADDDGSGCVWMRTDEWPMTNYAGDGEGAAINSDACGSGVSVDTSLISPAMNLSAASTAQLDFLGVYRHLGSASFFAVDISDDGGSSWTTELEWTEDMNPTGPGIPVEIDMDAYVGSSEVHVRFRYVSGWDWHAVVDDVVVTADAVSFPWAFVDPDMIIVPEGGSANVDLVVDATELEAGTYELGLHVISGSAYDVDPTEFTVEVEAVPEIVLPEIVNMEVEFGATGTAPMEVENLGGADGEVSIDFGGQLIFEQFEESFPPDGWTVTDDNGGGCVWMRTDEWPMNNYAGGDGEGAAINSDICGLGITVDSSLISPQMNLAGAESASFSVIGAYNHLGDSFLSFDVSDDGGASWTVEEQWTTDTDPEGPGTEVNIDLSDYLGSSEVHVRMRYSSGWDWWAVVDDVLVEASVTWVEAVPSTFNVPAMDSATTDITVDTTGLPGPGTYSAEIIGSVDSPFAIEPGLLVVDVVPGPDLGGVSGTVQSQGYCDSNPFDAAGATVEIVGQNETYTVTADDNGFYEIFLPIGESPVDITASAPNHISETSEDVDLEPADTITVDFDLLLDEPCVDTSPAAFQAELDPGESVTEQLTIDNLGAGELDWTLETAQPTVVTASQGQGNAGPGAGSGATAAGALDVFAAAGGQPPAIARVAPAGGFDCDNAPGLIIHDDGEIENGYSGNPDVVSEVTLVEGFTPESPGVIGTVCISLLSLGTDTLDFELVVFDDDGSGGVPGTELAAISATATDLPEGIPDTPAWYTVDLSGENILVESGTIYIGARYAPPSPNVFVASDEEGPGPGVGYFQTDGGAWDELGVAVFPDYKALFVRPQIQSPTGCDAPSDVSWLSMDPTSGTTGPGDSSVVDVTIDSTGQEPGDYEASVCVLSNDPENGVLGIPVSLTVSLTDDFATLNGQVESQGYCNQDPSAGAGAQIEIVGANNTYNVTADENGFYEIVLLADESPVDITASLGGHIDGVETGVGLTPQDTTTVDFDLLVDQPCIETSPESFMAELDPGESVVEQLTIDNLGAGVLEWDLETAQPTVVTASHGRGDAGPGAGSGATAAGSMDIFTAAGGQPPSIARVAPAGGFDCDNAPGLIIHDDGEIDNGYSGNPDVVSEVAIVEGFTPEGPGVIGTVCISLLSLGTDTLDFELVVFDDDGPGGVPGTELASISATATDIPEGIPDTPAWYTVDLGGENILVESGTIYIGARYAPPNPGVFVASDEEGPGPGVGYFQTDGGAWDDLVSAGFPNYKAMFIRPQVQSPTGCDAPGDVSWLSLDPASGTTDPNDSSVIDVTIDSSGQSPGDYEASICIFSNDAQSGSIAVPVSLSVGTPEGFAMIEGEVISQGHCNADPAPAAGAQVHVEGSMSSYTATVDGDGNYSLFLDADESPVDITVSHTDHHDAVETGVELVADETTTVHFDMILDAPCVDVTPGSFSEILDFDSSQTYSLTLDNTSGGGALEWSIELGEAADGSGFGVFDLHEPDLDEPLEVPDFTVVTPALGGEPEVFTIPGGLASSGDVVGFSFVGTVSGPGGTGTWASDMCMIIESPDGTSYGVGGISDTHPGCGNDNPWDFQGGGSTDDGTYESEHLGVFDPAVGGSGDWTLTFVHDWNSESAADMDWSEVTVTLHKQPLPLCDDPQGVSWLDVSEASGTTGAGESTSVDVVADSTGLAEGEYEAALCISTNDPESSLIAVPFNLMVVDDGIFRDRFEASEE